MKINDGPGKSNLILSLLLMKFKYFWSAQLGITTKCSSGCRHCIYAHVKKEDMPKKLIDKGLALFEELGIRRMLIAGGEPFESYSNLEYSFKKSLDFLHPSNIFLITSASWAHSNKIVEQKINPLVDMGIENISISLDSFHLENISISNYFLLLDYLKETGIVPVIATRYNKKMNDYRNLLKKIKREYDAKILTDVVVRTGGAASLPIRETEAEKRELTEFRKTFDSELYYISKSPINQLFESLVRTNCVYPSLFPNGDLHLCCRKNENTLICNLNTDDFYTNLKKFNDNCAKNISRVIAWPLSCNRCPISK